MRKVAIVAKDGSKIDDLKKILKKREFEFVTSDPDFVISFGGDGTFLIAERKFPGIPKLIIKDSKTCNKCVGSNKETILDFIKLDAYEVKDEIKLEGSFQGHEFIAINDFIIRNKTLNQAIRLALYIDGNRHHDEVIGDGLVVSTPFGSTAYFKSIARETFTKGIGLAFNNPVEDHDPIYLTEHQIIKIKLSRGDAQVSYDNEKKVYTLKEGEIMLIRKAYETAKVIKLEGYTD